MPYDFDFNDLVKASQRVAPFWKRLRSLRQEYSRLSLQAADSSLSLQVRLKATQRLDQLGSLANALAVEVDAFPPDDPTGKLDQLRQAAVEFARQCENRHQNWREANLGKPGAA